MEEKRCYGCMNLKSNESVCEHCGYDESIQNEIHQLPAGTVLKEQYMIGRVLGQGGFGITYLGWDMYLDIPVAIKEYFPSGTVMRETSVSLDVVSYSGDVGVRFRNNKERFLREAKMLARFSQVPEIVQIKNFFLANNTAYIVMEYVDGITLKQYVKRQGGKLSVSQTFSLMEPVIESLCKVHKSGLVHRDISPDNIMMLSGGRVKLLDFGAVRDVGDANVDHPLTKSTEAILKQGYAPIEQYQNRGSLGPWTDVYALCATIYFCLTGEVPPDAPERLLGDEEIDFKGLVPELTDRQADVLGKGMELRAQERIASMDELHQKLYQEVEEETSDNQNENADVVRKQKKDKDGQKAGAKLTKSQKIAVLMIAVIVLFYGVCFSIALNNSDSDSAGEASEEINMENVIAEGECGEELKWHLMQDGTFVLDGSGRMDDYNGLWMEDEGNQTEYDPNRSYAPWADHMEQIQRLVINDGITRIGDNAFVGAGNLVEIEWGKSLAEIGWMAFNGTGVEGLIFPDSIESIALFAFSNCQNLKHVDLPYRLAVLEAGTFQSCPKLESVVIRPYTTVETCEDHNGKLYTPFCIYDTEKEEYVLSDKLTIHTYKEAQAREFAEEYNIYHEIIHDGKCGDKVTWEFDDADGTLYLRGSGDTWFYGIEDERVDEMAEIYGRTQIFAEEPDWAYSFPHEIRKVVVTDMVFGLKTFLFAHLPNLETVELGETVDCLDANVFWNCDSLTEIVVPESVRTIGAYAFGWADNLRKVEILGGDVQIHRGAFAGAVGLEEVHCSEGTRADMSEDIFNPDGNDEVSEKAVFYVKDGSEMHNYVRAWKLNYEVVE